MFRFIFKKSNTIDFNKTLSKGSFGFLKAEKTLYFLYNFFRIILFWDLTSSGGGRYYTPPIGVF
jgi:hypothetical protein